MKIEIKLFATLKKYLPPDADGSSATIEVKNGLTVGGLIEHLKIPKELAQLVLVNGVNIEGDYGRKLQEEDTVSIFPPVAGGSMVIEGQRVLSPPPHVLRRRGPSPAVLGELTPHLIKA